MNTLRQRIAQLQMAILGVEPSPITRDELFVNYEVYCLQRHIDRIESRFPPFRPSKAMIDSLTRIAEVRR